MERGPGIQRLRSRGDTKPKDIMVGPVGPCFYEFDLDCFVKIFSQSMDESDHERREALPDTLVMKKQGTVLFAFESEAWLLEVGEGDGDLFVHRVEVAKEGEHVCPRKFE